MVLLLLVGGYFIVPSFLPSSPAPSSSLESDGGNALAGSATAVNGGREFARILVNLEGLRLNDDIFSDPLFRSLIDFSVDLEPQEKGRDNPFAPLGVDTGAGTQVSTGGVVSGTAE